MDDKVRGHLHAVQHVWALILKRSDSHPQLLPAPKALIPVTAVSTCLLIFYCCQHLTLRWMEVEEGREGKGGVIILSKASLKTYIRNFSIDDLSHKLWGITSKEILKSAWDFSTETLSRQWDLNVSGNSSLCSVDLWVSAHVNFNFQLLLFTLVLSNSGTQGLTLNIYSTLSEVEWRRLIINIHTFLCAVIQCSPSILHPLLCYIYPPSRHLYKVSTICFYVMCRSHLLENVRFAQTITLILRHFNKYIH